MSNNGTLSFDAVDYVIVLKGRLLQIATQEQKGVQISKLC